MEFVRDGGAAASIAGARRRALLATLGLNLGHTVTVDRIIDAVWGAAPPATVRNTVQVHIAGLRKVLGSPDCLAYRSPGYVLRLPEPGTDLAAVRHLVARADGADEPAERVPLLAEALRHWRGAALTDVVASHYFAAQAASLDELRTTIYERLLTDRLRLGQHRAAIPELEQVGREHPFRERPVRLLMTALYRDGRTYDAHHAFRALSDRLRDELGVQPTRHTVVTWRRILQGDPRLLAPPGARPAPSPR
ncbi:MAG: AfsR/SARP family transcriptional regulator [Nocardioides sp.]